MPLYQHFCFFVPFVVSCTVAGNGPEVELLAAIPHGQTLSPVSSLHAIKEKGFCS